MLLILMNNVMLSLIAPFWPDVIFLTTFWLILHLCHMVCLKSIENGSELVIYINPFMFVSHILLEKHWKWVKINYLY